VSFFLLALCARFFVVLVFDRREPMRNPEPKAQTGFCRVFASIVLPVEFAGSYIQTKFGDEKYHWGDEKLGLSTGQIRNAAFIAVEFSIGTSATSGGQSAARRFCQSKPSASPRRCEQSVAPYLSEYYHYTFKKPRNHLRKSAMVGALGILKRTRSLPIMGLGIGCRRPVQFPR
jgi:hypothetical protein